MLTFSTSTTTLLDPSSTSPPSRPQPRPQSSTCARPVPAPAAAFPMAGQSLILGSQPRLADSNLNARMLGVSRFQPCIVSDLARLILSFHCICPRSWSRLRVNRIKCCTLTCIQATTAKTISSRRRLGASETCETRANAEYALLPGHHKETSALPSFFLLPHALRLRPRLLPCPPSPARTRRRHLRRIIMLLVRQPTHLQSRN